MSDTSKALEALDRIFNYCEEIDLHIPEEEQTGYSMNDDVAIIREALFENQKTGNWINTGAMTFFDYHSIVLCSNCNYETDKRTNYCPKCGAKMKGE